MVYHRNFGLRAKRCISENLPLQQAHIIPTLKHGDVRIMFLDVPFLKWYKEPGQSG